MRAGRPAVGEAASGISGLFVSVDVDSLYLYGRLYGGHEGPERELVAPVYARGVTRFARLFEELGISATFFLVGQDLAHGEAAAVARGLVAGGHRPGNHSWSHPYDLIRLSRERMESELVMGGEAIARATGSRPTIFRAPGYNLTGRERRLLAELGYRYDSSPLPSPPYLALKYAVMAGLLLRGRPSQSIWGRPTAFAGPRLPYRADGLTVLPNATTPGLRLPVIGTSLAMAPEWLFRHLLAALKKEPFVALEFHAVDLMALAEDGLSDRLRSQKDLLVPVATKRDRFRRALELLMRTRQPFTPE